VQALSPFRQQFRSPDHSPVLEKEHPYRMETRIVEHNCLVGETESFRGAVQASGIAAADVNIRNIVPSSRNPKANPLNVQFRIF
jgi:hypothetical protein